MPSNQDASITITLLAKDLASGNIGGFIGKLDALAKQGGLVGAMAQGVGQRFGQMLNPIGLAQDAVGKVVSVFGDLVHAGETAQASQEKLRVSLEDNIPAWDGNMTAIEGAIKAGERLAFSADEQRNALALLPPRTHSVADATRLLAEAQDLARFKSVDLGTAMLVLGKVYSGSFTQAIKMGIAIKEGSTAQQALAQIQAATAGQALAYADTAQGAMESLNTTIEGAMQDIGKELLPTVKEFAVFARDELVPDVLKFAEALGEAGTQVNNLNRLIHPDQAEWADFNHSLVSGAENLGITTDALKAYIEAQPQYRGANLSAREATFILADAMGHLGGQMAAASLQTGLFGLKWQQAAGPLEQIPGTINDVAIAVQGASKGIFAPIFRSADKAITQTLDDFSTLGPSIHSILEDAKAGAASGMKDLMWAVNHPRAVANERSVLDEELHSEDLQKAMASKNPAIRKEANDLYQYLKAKISAIDALNATIDVSIRGANVTIPSNIFGVFHPHGGGRARGGYVAPGDSVRVGEVAEERLTMFPGGGGYVTADSPRRAGGLHLHLHYSPAYSSASVAEARRFGEAIMPDLVRAMRSASVG